MAKKKYYVVWEGLTPGIYDSWAKCQAQIKGYPSAKYKSFKSKAEAEAAFYDSFGDHIGTGAKKKKTTPKALLDNEDIVWDSISVDAACSGNPGVTEYQGVDTKTKAQIFHKKFPLGTNNIGEFLALVHGLALFKQKGFKQPIYTDSRTAMSWVKKKKVKTNLVRNAKTAELYELIERAENWLKNNEYETEILKWDTENWGEIPADFGRK
jgi:ribonuclease HI